MPQEKWDRYSASWSQPEADRNAVLAELATLDVAYTDPTTALEGPGAFSAYMGEFQQQFPGTQFQIIDVREHHEQSLANWKLVDGAGEVVMLGTSHARLTPEGKFRSFTGFF
ncbi:MAG: nuclear transport factor 2 family protein [Sphingomonadales bacterium]|jgi:hypothetical protein|nr:nuclear transport factor 2 family protein [Sphingomonadales bacterium]